MIYPLSGGGSGEMFALVSVTYPAGSVCTCTNGSKTLKAKDTSGTWLCAVPKEGTWTVMATDGTNSKSQSVNITAEGQCESMILTFGYYLFTEGKGLTEGYTLEFLRGDAGYSVSASGIVWSTNTEIGNNIYPKQKVNLTNYSALCFEIQCNGRKSSSYSVTIGVGDNPIGSFSDISDLDASTTNIWDTGRKTHKVDLSAISGEKYIKFAARYTTGTIYNIWLEE